MGDGGQTEPIATGHSPNVILRVEGVSKTFGATRALDCVDLEVRRGSVHALLGGNGSGKSTLIKALAGVQQADAGLAWIVERKLDLRHVTPGAVHEAGIRFVHQNDSTFPTLSVAENLAVGSGYPTGFAWRISWREQMRRARSAIERFGIKAQPSDLVQDLSPATRKMVEIARSLQDVDESRPGVLVLDEPTASLPTAEANVLLEAISRYAAEGQSIIYVTHRLEEVFALADEATILRDGQTWATVRPQEMTHDDLVTSMMGEAWEVAHRPHATEFGPPVLATNGVSTGAAVDCSLVVRAGEIVGIAGLIGSGRSSLLKGLFGALPVTSGTITVDGRPLHASTPRRAMRSGVAYVPEDRTADAVFPGLSVREHLSIAYMSNYWRGGFIRRRVEHTDSERLIKEYLIKAPSDVVSIGSLSGGNQQKVVLARWLRRHPRVVLLDEPTQGVDVRARAEIYQLISGVTRGGAAVVFVSSDFEELVSVCDSIRVMRNGRLGEALPTAGLDAETLNVLVHAQASREPLSNQNTLGE